MAKKEELLLTPVEPQGEVRIDMAKEDLVTVGLVEIENELGKRHTEAKARLKTHNAAKEVLQQKQAKLVQQWSERARKDVLALWQEPLRALLGARAKRVDATVTINSVQYGSPTQLVVAQLNERRDMVPTVRGSSMMSESRDARACGQAFTASYGLAVEIPADLIAAEQERADLCKLIQDEEMLIMEIKQKLSNMNRYERQLRAELVKARLGGTAEGRKLLAVITQNLTDRIGLPAPQ